MHGYVPDKTIRTHALTHRHRTSVMATMSRSPQADSTKITMPSKMCMYKTDYEVKPVLSQNGIIVFGKPSFLCLLCWTIWFLYYVRLFKYRSKRTCYSQKDQCSKNINVYKPQINLKVFEKIIDSIRMRSMNYNYIRIIKRLQL